MTRFALASVVALALSAAPARADLVLTMFGTLTLSGDSTLNGQKLGQGEDVSFLLTAAFDPAADTDPADGAGTFQTRASFLLPGYGEFTSADGALNVVLTGGSGYFVGLSSAATGESIGVTFDAALPGYDPDEPAPSTLTGTAVSVSGSPFPFLVPLAGGDELVIDGVAFVPFAALNLAPTAVPEPGAVTTAVLGLASAAGLVRRCRRPVSSAGPAA